ncbi:hypothetical protein Acsp01_27540 [Actinoplanes sp. NBRC 101535]|nr:hypothetical protein Acsp01_27540 [Actinoplanes sp. NBRC 101535]
MPLLNLDRLCEGLEKTDWAGLLKDWDSHLRADPGKIGYRCTSRMNSVSKFRR